VKRTYAAVKVFAGALLLFAGLGASAPRPNFSGTWALEHARSFSVPRDSQQTMAVSHEGDRVSVETKIVSPQGERVVKDSYALDGKEAEFTPQVPADALVGKGKRIGRWLPSDNGFVVEEEFQTKTPEGKTVENRLTRKWIMWADGSLSIDLYTDGPRGSFETKRVFVKSAQASDASKS
jgi:hypothetical protein